MPTIHWVEDNEEEEKRKKLEEEIRAKLAQEAQAVAEETPPPAFPADKPEVSHTEGEQDTSPTVGTGIPVALSKAKFTKRNMLIAGAVVAVIIVLIAVWLVKGNSQQQGPDKNFTDGITYFDKGAYENAITAFTKSIALNPEQGEAYSRRGLSYAKKAQIDLALADYVWRDTTYFKEDIKDLALTDCKEALRIVPNNKVILGNCGDIYKIFGEYDTAIQAYSKALVIDPNYAQVYANRGDAYSMTGKYDQAITDFSKAIELDPNYVWAYAWRGNAYNDTAISQYDRAVADTSKAIELDPTLAYTYGIRGASYLFKGEYDQAMADLDKAIELDPKYVWVYQSRAWAYSRKGQYDQAIADYSKLIELDPNSSSYLNSRAWYNFYIGKLSEALVDADKALSIDPNAGYIYDTRGTIYRAMDDYDKAISDYTQAIRINPDRALFWMNRAITHLWKNQNQVSYNTDRTRALQLDRKGAAEAYVDIAINRLETGYYSDAVRYFDNALELNPDDERILKLKAEAAAKAK
ncbi:hypothetical protein AGMMS49587_04700 [Spirochaetia bacterium]|nr:hypothetical protein AGMMS49587_04700 [Spirochaetia bacterium]